MDEIILDEFGIPKKTGKDPSSGIKRSEKILQKFSGDYGPISEYKEFLKREGRSDAYASFQEDYSWLEKHLGKIADYIFRELGMEKISMNAYLIQLKLEDHSCLQINFPYENTVLKYHYHGPNFAQYITSTISDDISFRQEDLVDFYFTRLMESIPEHQLKHLNWIEPKFISNYALDADPHITMQLEFDLAGIKKENSGVYSDLFIMERTRFPFFPFQPIFGGHNKETALIILPQEELFDIEDFRFQIAKRLNINPQKMNINKRYNFKIEIEDLKDSVCLRTAREIRIKYKDTKEISEYAQDFIRMTQEGIRGAQKCAASDFVKGKEEESLEKGLIDRILSSYRCPSFVNLTSATFGPPEEHIYFDDDLRIKMYKKFKDYKEKKLNK